MQQIEKIFKVETTSDGQWCMVPRRPIETRDGKMLAGTGGTPVAPQVRITNKASPITGRWRYRDSAATTRDTVISTVTPEEDAEWSKRMATMSGFNGGTMWQGDLKPVGEAVARVADALRRVKGSQRQKDALSQAVCAIANFGNDLGNSEADLGPADALAFEGNDELTLSAVHEANGIKPDPTTSEGARAEVDMNRRTGDAINAANAKLWANNGKPNTLDAKPRDATRALIQKTQRANDQFWAAKTAHQRTPPKEWGKG
jgi:hypothetical protein